VDETDTYELDQMGPRRCLHIQDKGITSSRCQLTDDTRCSIIQITNKPKRRFKMTKISKTIEKMGAKGFSGWDFLLGISVTLMAVALFVVSSQMAGRSVGVQDTLEEIEMRTGMIEQRVDNMEHSLWKNQMRSRTEKNSELDQRIQYLLQMILDKTLDDLESSLTNE
jgi:hypothetical protein